MKLENVRSPSEKVGGICYFGRMLDKIRLHAAGQLPPEYHANLGSGFDERCVHFLWLDYPALVERVKKGDRDEEVLDWAFAQGRKPGEEEIEIWNEFMRKRGWNDEATPILQRRLRDAKAEHRTDIQTMFAYIDFDEGQDPQAAGPTP